MNIELTLKEFCILTSLLGNISANEFNQQVSKQKNTYKLNNKLASNLYAPMYLQLIHGSKFTYCSDDLGELYNKLDNILVDTNKNLCIMDTSKQQT